MRRSRRGCLLPLVLVLAVLAAVWLGRFAILAGVAQFLVDTDPPAKVDAIVLLNGDPTNRPFAAARLLRDGYASQILIARAESSAPVQLGLTPNTTDVSIGVLEKSGVAPVQIQHIQSSGGVTSTFEEAQAIRQHLAASPSIRRLLIVTSAIHTRRTRWVFEKVFRGADITILVYGEPDRRYNPTNWWKREEGFLNIQNEYLKLLYYRVKY